MKLREVVLVLFINRALMEINWYLVSNLDLNRKYGTLTFGKY